MNWKFFVQMALPLLRAAGESKKNEDENTTGKDDLIGVSLVYAADLIEAVLKNKTDMPKAPPSLR